MATHANSPELSSSKPVGEVLKCIGLEFDLRLTEMVKSAAVTSAGLQINGSLDFFAQ